MDFFALRFWKCKVRGAMMSMEMLRESGYKIPSPLTLPCLEHWGFECCTSIHKIHHLDSHIQQSTLLTPCCKYLANIVISITHNSTREHSLNTNSNITFKIIKTPRQIHRSNVARKKKRLYLQSIKAHIIPKRVAKKHSSGKRHSNIGR